MALYLVQHGAAKSESEDPVRPLTEEGRRVVERVAEFLVARGVSFLTTFPPFRGLFLTTFPPRAGEILTSFPPCVT